MIQQSVERHKYRHENICWISRDVTAQGLWDKKPAQKSPQVSFLLSVFPSLPNEMQTQRNISLCSQNWKSRESGKDLNIGAILWILFYTSHVWNGKQGPDSKQNQHTIQFLKFDIKFISVSLRLYILLHLSDKCRMSELCTWYSKWCWVIIHTHHKNLLLKPKGERGQNGVEKERRGKGELVIQGAHKVYSLRHILNHKLENRNNRNTTKVFKIKDGISSHLYSIFNSKQSWERTNCLLLATIGRKIVKHTPLQTTDIL